MHRSLDRWIPFVAHRSFDRWIPFVAHRSFDRWISIVAHRSFDRWIPFVAHRSFDRWIPFVALVLAAEPEVIASVCSTQIEEWLRTGHDRFQPASVSAVVSL